MMNELITSIFSGFTVDGVSVPVKYLRYYGHGEPYVVWMREASLNSLSGDDEIEAYYDYFDFDVYSKTNFEKIIESVKATMKENGFSFQPSRCSADMFENETGYYHKTLSFAIEHWEEE